MTDVGGIAADRLARLRAKLEALKAKTSANGCTEAEAMAAAEKYVDLLARHGLTEADLEALAFEELTVPIAGRRTFVDAVWMRVGSFARCLAYVGADREGRRAACYFGRAHDVPVAGYVHDVLARAIGRAETEFKASAEYRRRRLPKTRSRTLRAFRHGLSVRICRLLDAGLWRRLEGEHGSDQEAMVRDFVQLNELLRDQLARRGIGTATAGRLAKPERRYDAAGASGWHAGAGIDVNAGVGSAASPVRGLLT